MSQNRLKVGNVVGFTLYCLISVSVCFLIVAKDDKFTESTHHSQQDQHLRDDDDDKLHGMFLIFSFV